MSAVPAVCVSVFVCVLHVRQRISVHTCTPLCPQKCFKCLSLTRGLVQVRRGDIKVGDVMSWFGNYSDRAFGSHKPSQCRLKQEDMSRATEAECLGQMIVLSQEHQNKQINTEEKRKTVLNPCCVLKSEIRRRETEKVAFSLVSIAVLGPLLTL